jgi:hypothetical protein
MTSFFPQLEVNSDECFLPCFSSQNLFDEDITQVSYMEQENQHMYHDDIMMNRLYDQLGSEVEGIESRVQDVTSNSTKMSTNILQHLQLKVFSDRKKNVPGNVMFQKTMVEEQKRQQLLQQKQLSTTEKAGRRLYRQGLERNARLQERKERSKLEPKKLELATKSSSYSLRLKSPDTSSISTSSLSMSSSDSSSSSPPRTRNMKACQRLYDLSKPKQMRGKQRRDEITKARERASRNFDFPSSKITIKEAISIYARGMKHLYALEKKRIASFAKREIAYQSYLIPETSKC